MNYMKQAINFTLGLFLLLFLHVSCEKETPDWTYSTDDTMADMSFADIYYSTSKESNGDTSLRSCATVSYSGQTFPLTVTFDYSAGTGCGDGRVRSGTLTAVYSGRWNQTGTTVSISTNDYTVDGYQIEGTYVISNITTNLGSPKYSTEIQNGKVTTPSGDVILREATKYYEMIAGVSSPFDLTDDVWEITGNAAGTTSSGKTYTANITTPVIKDANCNWIQQGVVEIIPSAAGSIVRKVDYGPNVCDNVVTVSYGSWSMDISLQ